MTLILSNEEIEQVLSMKDLVQVIEEAYILVIDWCWEIVFLSVLFSVFSV
jgi:hypothetical protein